jgi:hypothetical protein
MYHQLPLVVRDSSCCLTKENLLKGERARELNYTLRLRLPTMRLYARTMTAITRRR